MATFVLALVCWLLLSVPSAVIIGRILTRPTDDGATPVGVLSRRRLR